MIPTWVNQYRGSAPPTPAVLSSPSATPRALPIFTGSVTTDTGSGTLYWVVTTSATPPSATQIKAGQTNTGSAATASGNQAVSASGVQNVSGTGTLIGSTTYYLYFVQDNGANSNVAATSSWVSYNQETIDLVPRMTVTPDFTRQGVINTLIGSLKSSGVWAKLDVIHVMAAHDAQAARLNWKSTNYTATAISSPTFTADRGYNGDGSASYIDSGFNPATAGGNFTQNNGSLSIWSRSSGQFSSSAAGWFDGTDGVTLLSRNTSNNGAGRINQTAVTSSAGGLVTDGAGLFSASRTSSSLVTIYRNAVSLTTSTAGTVAMNSNNLLYGRTATASYNNMQFAAGLIGADLLAADQTAAYNALQTYMTAIGA